MARPSSVLITLCVAFAAIISVSRAVSITCSGVGLLLPSTYNYALFAGAGYTFAGGTASSRITGNIASYPTPSPYFKNPKVVLVGIEVADGTLPSTRIDIGTMYGNGQGLTMPASTPIIADLGGKTLAPGVYKTGSTIAISGTLYLDAQGDPKAIFIFQGASTIIFNTNSQIVLLNGASPCHIFWFSGSSITIDVNSKVYGIFNAQASITVNSNSVVVGHLFALAAITIGSSRVSLPTCNPDPCNVIPPILNVPNFDAVGGPLVLNEDLLCYRIGVSSGCSGCVVGTKNLCSWISTEVPSSKRSFGLKPVMYSCVRRDTLVERLLLDTTSIDVSYLCPKNASMEPMVRTMSRTAETNTWEHVSVVYSSGHSSDYAEFPQQPWAVDRFSYAGPLGFAALTAPYQNEGARVDCTRVVTHEIGIILYEGFGKASTLFNGYLLNENDKFCARLALAGYIASRCPEYGVAVSGLCQTFYDHIQTNCASRSHAGPISGFGESSKAFEPYIVVPDSAPFCLSSFPVEASGHLEHLFGIDIPVQTLASMASKHHYIEYNWPIFHQKIVIIT